MEAPYLALVERREAHGQRIVETIELGDGVPLETPRDHWSLRQA